MVSVSVDMAKLERDFKSLGAGAPRAIAQTLTIIAGSCRKKLVETLPDYFTLRGNWTIGGMRYDKATPRDLTASVGTSKDYTVDHIEGGTRDSHIAVPGVGPGLPRSNKKAKTPQSKFPKALKAKARRRIFVGPTSTGTLGLWLEFGPRKNPGLKLLYAFPEKTTVKKAWPMHEIIEAQAEKRFARAVLEAGEKWMRMAK